MPRVHSLQAAIVQEKVPQDCDARQEFFMRKAAQLAFKSNMGHRHGCLVVINDEIISTGYNHTKIHFYHNWSCHAEIDALRKIKRNVDLSNAEMYVVRIGPESLGHPFKMSKPCEGCEAAILKCGIKRVYYSWSHVTYTSEKTKVDKKTVMAANMAAAAQAQSQAAKYIC